jgi:murein DD-endopeptidase MepM/ murein hydrolase activator NlpD
VKTPCLLSSELRAKVRKMQRRAIWFLFGVVLLSSACHSRLNEGEDWAYPFPLKESNNCYKVVTTFSVENPWDHAHEAVDFACLPDTPVIAVQAGVIEKITYVEILDESRARISLALSDSPISVEYLNLKGVTVQEDQAVAKGAQIGLSDRGLHLAVWDREQNIYVDPGGYLTLPVPEESIE